MAKQINPFSSLSSNQVRYVAARSSVERRYNLDLTQLVETCFLDKFGQAETRLIL